MARLIKIRDWDKHFEVAQSRKIEGALTWVGMPTKHDGKGYRRIMAHANGPAIFGAWCVLVQVAAKADRSRRGTFADDSGPLSTFDLHLKTALPESLIEDAINLLSSKEIGWLVVEEWEPSGSEVVLQNKTGHDTTKHDTTEQRSSVVVDLDSGEPEPLGQSWLALVDRLKAEGMDFAAQACESARTNGCIASEAEFLLNHWLAFPGAWSIGVLFNKIKGLRPDRKAAWPEPSADFKKRKADAVGAAKICEQIKTRREAEGNRDSAANRRKQLDVDYGKALDSMSKKKLREFLLVRQPGLAVEIPAEWPIPIGMFRYSVLSELESAAKQPTMVSKAH